jgi:ABC-2 type transport system ATP-binding protein
LLCSLGKTVFLTTHFMDEAQTLADRVAVMVAGEIVACGPPGEIGGREQLPTEIRFVLPGGVDVGELPQLPTDAVISLEHEESVLIKTSEGLAATHALSGWGLQRGLELRNFSVAQPTLEDVYLALTGTGREPDSPGAESRPAIAVKGPGS